MTRLTVTCITLFLQESPPNAEQVSIYVQGTETKKTIIHGSVYCGGNSASLSSSMDNPKVELKVGSYAIVDNLFFGNNGEHMVETHEKDATHAQDGVLRTMKSTSITSDGSQFSSIDLTVSETFKTYMEGVTMPLIPSIVFAKKSNGDPADYVPYSSYKERRLLLISRRVLSYIINWWVAVIMPT